MVERRLIGEGRTAEVFEWGEGRALKLYRASCPRDWTAREVEVVRALTGAGVAAPAVLDTVEVDGRAGIVLERVRGRSLRAQITDAPWSTGRAGRLLARLHAELHAHPVAAPLPRLPLPSMPNRSPARSACVRLPDFRSRHPPISIGRKAGSGCVRSSWIAPARRPC